MFSDSSPKVYNIKFAFELRIYGSAENARLILRKPKKLEEKIIKRRITMWKELKTVKITERNSRND